ncbi:MAG TPA: T9SS type A sorting domain-containing protein [Edaphocola sp.]|nr:T9SS type A sorting domain-containing protein [Edaphocola sp.]
MKKILLSIIALGFTYFANAQYVLKHDTMSTTTQGTDPAMNADEAAIYFKNYVINTGNDTLTDVKWRIIENNLPFGWYLYTFCDNVFCRSQAEVLSHLNNPNQVETMDPIFPNDTLGALLEPAIVVSNTGDNGTGIVKVRVFNSNQSDTAVYIVQKTNVGVNGIVLDDNKLSLFPNPGGKELNVFVNNSLIAKSIKVFNVLGQQIVNTKVNAEIIKINTSNFAAGNYTLVVEGQNGAILASRSWTKK